MPAGKANKSNADANTETEYEAEVTKHPRRSRSMLDVLIYVCGTVAFIGCACIGYLGVAGGFRNQRILALEILYGTLVFVLTGAFLYFYQNLQNAASKALADAQVIPAPTDRAWLTVEAAPNGPFSYAGDTANLSVQFAVKNVRGSVATDVTLHAEVVAVSEDALFTEPVKRQKKLCENIEPPLTPMGITIFPTDSKVLAMSFGISKQEMEAHRIKDRNAVALYLVGCVDYLLPEHPVHHRTGFIYEVRFSDPAKDVVHPFLMQIGRNVPTDKIVLTKYIFGGDYAD